MDQTNERIKKQKQRLVASLMRLLSKHGFYGLLLMQMNYSLDEEAETAYTDGRSICFNPIFLDSLKDSELDFIMLHEILHVVLRHCFRGQEYDQEIFNIACDIVVNSNILLDNNMNLNSITVKEYGISMHLAPNKKEGYLYTAEEVYEMLISCNNLKELVLSEDQEDSIGSGLDSHDNWDRKSSDLDEEWQQRIIDAAASILNRDEMLGAGTIPALAQRILKELKNPQIDWRTILQNFIQEDITDYSFSPPDKRFDDSPFIFPDFNEKEESVKNILFMIDTSGSMDDNTIAQAYTEIKGAIEQFNGALSGYLGFFDAEVYEPIPFENVTDLLKIKPLGGGGTYFDIIFKYIKEKMSDELPASIIILTDGYATFPKESESMGIPVLWILNNNNVKPPWGQTAIIKVDK